MSCHRRLHPADYDYKGEPNYEQFYVVDTITIENPVRIYSSRYGGTFIVSKATLKEYNGKKDFFYRPDVFIYGDEFYVDLPLKNFKRYKYPDDGRCTFEKWQQKDSDLTFQVLSPTPKKFILGLISANHFYKKHIAFDGHQFVYPEKNYKLLYNKLIYYKIVYPMCN
ncbi:MAG: hypothetical protein ACXVJB_05265 [Mucilaginibacter sp.]